MQKGICYWIKGISYWIVNASGSDKIRRFRYTNLKRMCFSFKNIFCVLWELYIQKYSSGNNCTYPFPSNMANTTIVLYI